ncbi:MAG: MBL fold metallo-hydrolase [Clostridia bacterium]|nr:MBL fold metallo-hydrolase [Clostridia bacterium]
MKQAVVEQMVLGMVGTNTWFLKNKVTSEMIIIDPADRADLIENKVQQMEGKPVAILLTHGHFDHMMAADDVRDIYGVPVIAFAGEQKVLTDPEINLSASWASSYVLLADQWVLDKAKLNLAGFEIEVLHTPGHTQGSCCFYLKDEEVLFSGDTLFAGSVGRTDFPTSSGASMKESVARLLKELPEETRVFPGHNEETTIAYEKRYNPFA